jgi:hypothetical protein
MEHRLELIAGGIAGGISWLLTSPSAPPPAAAVLRSILQGWYWFPLAAIPIGAGWWMLGTWRKKPFQAETGRGIEQMFQGDLAGAQRTFETVKRRYRIHPTLRVNTLFNLANVRVREGDLAGAIGQILALEEEQLLWVALAGLSALSARQLAICYGLLGDLDNAERWMATTRERVPRPEDTSLLFPETVLACRRGRYDEIAHRLAAQWREAESTLPGSGFRGLRVLRAFALHQSGGPRMSGQVDELLTGMRPTRPQEFDWLGKHWPELAMFLETQGLVASAPQSRSSETSIGAT